MVYVISITLVYKRTFSVLKIISIPVRMNQDSFFYIDVGESVLSLEGARQYFTMKESELVSARWKQVTMCAIINVLYYPPLL